MTWRNNLAFIYCTPQVYGAITLLFLKEQTTDRLYDLIPMTETNPFLGRRPE